ncbi:MAG: NmrA/HSCARG family protein [Thermoplasmata archaeon]|nr:MAG: NmrA/HSCARG family protein [Thermoplasmata archaeon]
MDKTSRTILVLGATGNQGGAVLRHLMPRGWRLRAMTRDASKPAAMDLAAQGVEVVEGDWMDPESLERAMDGCYGVYAVTTPYEVGVEGETAHGIAMADAAHKMGVEHYVYSSVASANDETGIPHFESKRRVEMHLKELNLPYTIVRPVFLMENFTLPSTKQSITSGTLSMAINPDQPLQMIALDDVGYAVARVFDRREKYLRKAVDLAGDELTMPEAAKRLGEAMGCDVTFKQVSMDNLRALSDDYAAMYDWFNRGGYHVDLEMQRVFNPRIHRFDDWVRETKWSDEECEYPTAEHGYIW